MYCDNQTKPKKAKKSQNKVKQNKNQTKSNQKTQTNKNQTKATKPKIIFIKNTSDKQKYTSLNNNNSIFYYNTIH